MKRKPFLSFTIAAGVFLLTAISVSAQQSNLIKRTTSKSDTFDFGPGGSVSIVGAPAGSIRIEGWSNSKVQLEAEIEIQAPTEADLNILHQVTGFILDESFGRTDITTVGTHDKAYLKRIDKKFPKHLIGLPFKIDYVLKVPRYCDLQIDGGKGDLYVGGVDGTIKVNYVDTKATLDLVGGGVYATFGAGTVDVTVPSKSWRGRFADIQLAAGTMNISLPPSLNAELDATILRSGAIENSFADLKPRTRKDPFTEKMIAAVSGNGGVPLKFTVGDGRLKISQLKKQ
jgi:hypothetical protein